MSERVECPSCGGAGGGPFGPSGSAWDTEDFVCTRCQGVGTISIDVRPGIAKTTKVAEPAKKKKTGTTDN